MGCCAVTQQQAKQKHKAGIKQSKHDRSGSEGDENIPDEEPGSVASNIHVEDTPRNQFYKEPRRQPCESEAVVDVHYTEVGSEAVGSILTNAIRGDQDLVDEAGLDDSKENDSGNMSVGEKEKELEFDPPDSILKVNQSHARKVPTLSPSEVQPSIRSSRDGRSQMHQQQQPETKDEKEENELKLVDVTDREVNLETPAPSIVIEDNKQKILEKQRKESEKKLKQHSSQKESKDQKSTAQSSKPPILKRAEFQILKLVQDKNKALSLSAPKENQFAQEVLELHNQLRTEPGSFIPLLKDRLNTFEKAEDGSLGLVMRDSSGKKFVTVEGAAAVQETIKFLQHQQTLTPLKKLKFSSLLSIIACNHAIDSAVSGFVGHKGSDGRTPVERIKGVPGRAVGSIGESINYSRNKPIDVVLALLIDDGYKSRQHRRNIFNSEFRVLGVGKSEAHTKHKYVTVLDYTGGILDSQLAQKYDEAIKQLRQMTLKVSKPAGAGKFIAAKSQIKKSNGGRIAVKETKAIFEEGVQISQKIGVEIYNSDLQDE